MGQSKHVSDADMKGMRKMRASGATLATIAARFGFSAQAVGRQLSSERCGRPPNLFELVEKALRDAGGESVHIDDLAVAAYTRFPLNWEASIRGTIGSLRGKIPPDEDIIGEGKCYRLIKTAFKRPTVGVDLRRACPTPAEHVVPPPPRFHARFAPGCQPRYGR